MLTLDVLAQSHLAGSVAVGEPPRSQDRPVEPAVAQRDVGVALGLHVGLPDGLGVVGHGIVDVDRRDLHEPVDAGLLSGLDGLQRSAEVDGALAVDVAVGSTARGEHHRVALGERGGEVIDLVLLDVEHPDMRAELLEVVLVRRVPHEGHRLVAGGGELADEVSGDLSVAAHDGDLAHAANLRRPH